MNQSVDGAMETYHLDLNSGLTQVLSDWTSTYLYGQNRISREQAGQINYFLPDALGSVRTVVSGEEVLLVQDFMPYGEVLASSGAGASPYGFADEWTDASGMQYLRARYYDPAVGRFVSRDRWGGLNYYPSSMNRWMYVGGNPINFTDPLGLFPCPGNMMNNNCEITDWAPWLFRGFQKNITISLVGIEPIISLHECNRMIKMSLDLLFAQKARPWLSLKCLRSPVEEEQR